MGITRKRIIICVNNWGKSTRNVKNFNNNCLNNISVKRNKSLFRIKTIYNMYLNIITCSFVRKEI